eukprot:15477866-Alexandrium_andersonii.AAC.1
MQSAICPARKNKHVKLVSSARYLDCATPNRLQTRSPKHHRVTFCVMLRAISETLTSATMIGDV